MTTTRGRHGPVAIATICLTLAAAGLAGCSQSGAGSAQAGPTATQSATNRPASSAPVVSSSSATSGSSATNPSSAGATPSGTASLTPSASPTTTATGSASASATATPSARPMPSAQAGSSLTGTLKPGMKGAQVTALQSRLTSLGYWLSATNGSYGLTTKQAVMALQKAAGLSRDGVAGPKTMAALNAGTRPTARTSVGRVIEIDKKRQLIKVVDGGRVVWAFNTSTGTGRPYTRDDGGTSIAVTPAGSFRIGRQIRGWRKAPLGLLYAPKYFNGGIAIHGSNSIPGYPASHGCTRVSVPAMDFLWSSGLAPIGARVLVY